MPKALATLAIALLLVAGVTAARADDPVAKALGVAAGAYASAGVAGPLNDAVNTLLLKSGAPNREANKVVPILTVGDGTAIGAAQIVGSQANVNATKAVVAIKTHAGGSGAFTISALVPVNSLSVSNGIHRQYGVGVDAVINAQL